MAKFRSSCFGSFMYAYAIFQQYLPTELRDFIKEYWTKLLCYFSPYIVISIYEYSSDSYYRSRAYSAVEIYLSTKSSTSGARSLKVDTGAKGKDLVFMVDEGHGITDVYEGVGLCWFPSKVIQQQQTLYPAADKRLFKLKFHRKHRDFITGTYMNYVMEQAKEIANRNRQIKLYTNNGTSWIHVVFDHPSRFQNLAMDPVKKQDIMDDLETFSKAKDYYAKVGKAWKRGYLLYGPPGTGKSTTIAAIANFLNYDIYDLELTAVKENNELRKLLTKTTNKSIIVVEDIDCSLDLTGQREKVKSGDGDKEKNPIVKKAKEAGSKESKVTLSGLLNVIDGLWSSCGQERIIIFTTNYVEKLDPALIRRGRMDKHIELSYCGFEGFKVLAKNYLDIDSHPLFDTIRELIEETQMSPADVAENLMPKTVGMDTEIGLQSLVRALENAKEEAKVKKKKKAEEEEAAADLKRKAEEVTDLKRKAEEEAKLKKAADSSSDEDEDSDEDDDEDEDSDEDDDEDDDEDEDSDEDDDEDDEEDEDSDEDNSSCFSSDDEDSSCFSSDDNEMMNERVVEE